jgi:hypothetical protein
VGGGRTELCSIPGRLLRSGGSVSPGRLAQSGNETGPDGGSGRRSSATCAIRCGGGACCAAAGAAAGATGADCVASAAGAAAACVGSSAEVGAAAGDGVGAAAAAGAEVGGAVAVGVTAGADAWGGVLVGAGDGGGTSPAGGALSGVAAARFSVGWGGVDDGTNPIGSSSGARITSLVHPSPSHRRRRAGSAGSGYHPADTVEAPSPTLTPELPSLAIPCSL